MNIHILSDSPWGASAYSSIARNLALGLAKLGHRVAMTGFISGYENLRGLSVLPLATPFTSAQAQFAGNLRSTKAEVLVCIHEAHGDYNAFSKMFSPCYFWVPVEGDGIPKHMREDLSSGVNVVSMSSAGQEALKREGIGSRVMVIYPGWNPEALTKSLKPYCKYSADIYQRLMDPRLLCERGCFDCQGLKQGCKYFESERVMINVGGSEFSGPLSGLEKIRENLGAEHVIGCVGMNRGMRKRFERLIEAFSLLDKECLLHLHTFPVPLDGANLFEVAKKYNVLSRVVFSYGENSVYGISEPGMNLLYDYFTFHATASSAEGFGLPLLESMAVGKAQVAPRFGVFPELVGEDRGLLASVSATQMLENGSLRCLVDTKSLAEKMEALCLDSNLRKRLGSAAEEWAKQYTWDRIVALWDALLTEGEKNRIGGMVAR